MATQVSLNSGAVSSVGTLKLQTNGTTDAVTIDTAQNLGLGVTPSAWGSSYKAMQITAGAAVMGDGNNYYALANSYFDGTNFKYIASTYALNYRMAGGIHSWHTASSGTAGNPVTFTQAMTLDASGNLGVGTSSPSTGSLNRQITINSGASSYAGVVLQNNTTGTSSTDGCVIYTDGTNMGLTNNEAGVISFNNNGAERARIDSSGNLLVGTTTHLGTSLVSTNIGGYALGSANTSGNYRQIYWDTGTGNLYFYNGSNQGYLNSAGSWINASDARLKNSIETIKHGLDAVMAAQPRSYKMNDVEGDFIGFVAQEIQQVIPEVVSGDPEKQLGVDYGSLVAVAFKAIQELKADLDATKAELAALKG